MVTYGCSLDAWGHRVAAYTARGCSLEVESRRPNRLAHRHQQSPGRTPGKLYSGMAWCSGLPTAAETARNFSVASMHTVCRPSSCGPVLQKPSR